MKLPSLTQLDHGVGGRPSGEPKIRTSFYLSAEERSNLEALAHAEDMSISAVVRKLVRTKLLKSKSGQK